MGFMNRYSGTQRRWSGWLWLLAVFSFSFCSLLLLCYQVCDGLRDPRKDRDYGFYHPLRCLPKPKKRLFLAEGSWMVSLGFACADPFPQPLS